MSSAHKVLGFVSEIRYTDKNGVDYLLEFKQKKSWNPKTGKNSFLMITANQKQIKIVPWSNVTRIPVPMGVRKIKGFGKSKDYFEAFSIKTTNSDPKLIGYITRIEYTSDQFDNKGFVLYRHEMKRKQKLYSNRALTIFAIKSDKTLLNYRGIIG